MGYRWAGVAQVLVDRLPADPVIAGKDDFRNAAAGPLDELACLFRCECLSRPLCAPRCLARAMPSRWRSLMRERSNSAKAPMTECMRLARGVFAREDQALLDEFHPYTFAGEALDKGA